MKQVGPFPLCYQILRRQHRISTFHLTIMVKRGKLKKRQRGGQFKTGHKFRTAYLASIASADAASDADEEAGVAVGDSQDSVSEYGLRKRADLETEDTDYQPRTGNRVIDFDVYMDLHNKFYAEHRRHNPNCLDIEWKLHNELKKGLGSIYQFQCCLCGFITSKRENYTRCRDSKGAAVNMLLASGLQDTCIGVEKATVLLASMDIPPPSRTHLQALVNTASQTTVRLNEEDMKVKRQAVVEHNRQQGSANPTHVDVSFDGRYNANRLTTSYKPGQAASQAYGVAIENHTDFKYVIGLAVQNKLCWTGANLRNRGHEDVKCPGHAGCTANYSYMEPHSERKMASSIAEQLSHEDIMVRTLTTDGDAKAYLGMSDFYAKLDSAWNVRRQADPHHLGARAYRKARSANWSKTMFGQNLKADSRRQATASFASDVKSRCSVIIEPLRAKSPNGDITESLHQLSDIRDATIQCYSGNCSFCPNHALVCDGIGGPGDWWFDSKFLPTHGIHVLNMTESDRALLSTVLETRLSESAVMSVASGTSTQKCEGFNRAVVSTMPKDVNLSRNFAGSLASKTLQLNNTLHVSVGKKVQVIMDEPLSPRAERSLQYTSRRAASHRSYQKTTKYKRRRKHVRAKLEHEYHLARSGVEYVEEYVGKGLGS